MRALMIAGLWVYFGNVVPVAAEPSACAPRDRLCESRKASVAESPRLWTLVHAGLGTPYGGVGASAGVILLGPLALEAGLGVNLQGLQVAALPRLRLLTTRTRVWSVGSGLSVGPFGTRGHPEGLFGMLRVMEAMRHGPPPAEAQWSRAYWYNGEFSWESLPNRAEPLLRFYFGYASLLNPSDHTCQPTTPDERCPNPTVGLIYGGFGLGTWLM